MHPNGMPAYTGSVVAHSERSLASLQDAVFLGAYSGGVAALNHRLIAAMPTASDSSPSMIWDTRGFHNTRHSGQSSSEFFTAQRYDFLLPTENSEEPYFEI